MLTAPVHCSPATHTRAAPTPSHANPLTRQARDDWPSLLARLVGMRTAILTKTGLLINLTAEQHQLDTVRPQLDDFVSRLPTAPATSAAPAAPAWREAAQLLPQVDEAFVITSQVRFLASS